MLDKPVELERNARFLVTALHEGDPERESWLRLSATQLNAAYNGGGDDYPLDSIRELNPDYELRFMREKSQHGLEPECVLDAFTRDIPHRSCSEIPNDDAKARIILRPQSQIVNRKVNERLRLWVAALHVDVIDPQR